MTVRDDILAFLSDPRAFAAVVPAADAALWRRGLEEFALPRLRPPGRSLRPAQEAAWRGAAGLRACLVLGPPGTGKTFLLAWLAAGFVWARREAGRPARVLVTGFTREAIGNLLAAVAEVLAEHLPGVPAAFLGNPPGQPMPGVEVTTTENKEEVAAARGRLSAPAAVVGATGWTLYKLFDGGVGPEGDGPTARAFDLVLVDEASQLTLGHGLLGLSGLAEAGRVVAAGDDRQLPPVRPTTAAAAADGRALGGSLYDFLKTGGVPEFRLDETYRLNGPLARPVADLFYNGDYRSVVPDRRLALRGGWADGLDVWERVALDPDHPACVLVHDGPPAASDNPFERVLLTRLTATLAARFADPADLWADRLAVVTPFRDQNAALRAELGEGAAIETVDRIQGRERDAVLAGYVTTDPEYAHAAAGFLFCPRRFNVTVTRARSKLVLVVSRRLLEVLPSAEETFDAAGRLREYVLSCDPAGEVAIPGPDGTPVPVELRVRRFAPADAPEAPEEPAVPPPAPLTPAQQQLLAAVAAVVERNTRQNPRFNTAKLADVGKEAGRYVTAADLLELAAAGYVEPVEMPGPNGPWLVWRPRKEPRTPLPCDADTVGKHLDAALAEARGKAAVARYDRLRDRFAWFDETGADRFRPIAEGLAASGAYRFGPVVAWGKTVEAFDHADLFDDADAPGPAVPEPGVPADDAFRVLNELEDREERQIDFGVYEPATTPAELAAATGRATADVRAAFRELEGHRYVLRVGDDRFRSRSAELARELRYLKQRFGPNDQADRPFVVRGIRVRFRDRNKPTRNHPLGTVVKELTAALAEVPHAAAVLATLEPTLRGVWGVPAGMPVNLAGFQARALAEVLPAYLGRPAAGDTFAVVADTGSGKTEAAFLPLVAGAAADALAGRRGTKAVAVYPRIRLAWNQAGRVALLLQQLNAAGGPLLTVGLQTGDVPARFPPYKDQAALWPWDAAAGGYGFDFFACPAPGCAGGRLVLVPHAGPAADRLTCRDCGWTYAGWCGTKDRLAATPPDLFLTVTESLHQWLMDPRYGRLWGDDPAFAPPRAVMADEVHLYAHIHGAQLGYALRRLAARCRLNARAHNESDRPPAAVGMSATLGDPGRVWSELLGRPPAREVRPREDAELAPGAPREREPNPRAREAFYFVQPELESRGFDRIPGASTTVQALMCLAHGMRRRPGDRGGYRGLVFFDSIDTLKRLLDDYRDAEGPKGLAKYRTRRFPPAPGSNVPRTACCGSPVGCDAFRQGECWYFAARAPGSTPPAANDPHQVTVVGTEDGPVVGRYRPGQSLAVMPRPVYSGTDGKVDKQIRESDLVFATSSLEVGFDDPDMILVYQHFAPVNLASFVQRKGRGGRGADDRPVTGITLSAFSPRDTWYFRHPDELLDAGGFEVPLNPDNFFVRRGQAVACLLDAAARAAFRANAPLPEVDADHLPAITRLLGHPDTLTLLKLALGETVLADLKQPTVNQFWAAVKAATRGRPADSWRELLAWVPELLFEDINLPLLAVDWPNEWFDPARPEDPRENPRRKEKREEVALAFGECAPGNATRRYGARAVHWTPPPTRPAAPMLPDTPPTPDCWVELLTDTRRADLGHDDAKFSAELRRELPDDVNARFLPGRPVHRRAYRPPSLRLGLLGEFDRNGRWKPHWFCNPATRELRQAPDGPPGDPWVGLHHKSEGRLLGFPVVRPEPGYGVPKGLAGLGRLAPDLVAFTAGPNRTDTGLTAFRVFWGVDVRLKLDDRERTAVGWTVAFTDRQEDEAQLYGYRMETEGVRLTPAAAELDAFLDAEAARVGQDEPLSRWLHGQFFRYLLAARFAAAGLNGYAAGPVADLLVAANADPQLAPVLARQWKRGFDADSLAAALHTAHARYLSAHPYLSAERLDGHLETLAEPRFEAAFRESLDAVADPAQFRGYLRSTVLHGLALGLHELFVRHGRGDERRVLLHARLPVQFGDRGSDDLTVFEAGEGGDGTTRAFLKHMWAAFAEWRRGDLAACPYAAEDALARMVLSAPADSAAGWRALDPDDPATLPRVARELTGTDAVSAAHRQVIRRVLYESELVGGVRFYFYDVAREAAAVRGRLALTFGRDPSAWEAVSAAVAAATQPDPATPTLTKLHAAYAALERGRAGDADDDTLGPVPRLAEQVYRLGTARCVDGCRGCLHGRSPLMPDDQAATVVSRGVLGRYREFVLEPHTTVAAGPGAAGVIAAALAGTGPTRVTVEPAANDAHAAALRGAGFAGGEYDPLMGRVVWVRDR